MSDTDKAAKVLKEHGVAVSITEVVGISSPDVTGAFARVVKLLSDAVENVEMCIRDRRYSSDFFRLWYVYRCSWASFRS